MPLLAGILSRFHGFNCCVVFAIDPKSGLVDPNNRNNIPGLEALKDADRWSSAPASGTYRTIGPYRRLPKDRQTGDRHA